MIAENVFSNDYVYYQTYPNSGSQTCAICSGWIRGVLIWIEATVQYAICAEYTQEPKAVSQQSYPLKAV